MAWDKKAIQYIVNHTDKITNGISMVVYKMRLHNGRLKPIPITDDNKALLKDSIDKLDGRIDSPIAKASVSIITYAIHCEGMPQGLEPPSDEGKVLPELEDKCTRGNDKPCSWQCLPTLTTKHA